MERRYTFYFGTFYTLLVLFSIYFKTRHSLFFDDLVSNITNITMLSHLSIATFFRIFDNDFTALKKNIILAVVLHNFLHMYLIVLLLETISRQNILLLGLTFILTFHIWNRYSNSFTNMYIDNYQTIQKFYWRKFLILWMLLSILLILLPYMVYSKLLFIALFIFISLVIHYFFVRHKDHL